MGCKGRFLYALCSSEITASCQALRGRLWHQYTQKKMQPLWAIGQKDQQWLTQSMANCMKLWGLRGPETFCRRWERHLKLKLDYNGISLTRSSREPENKAHHPKIVLSGKERKNVFSRKTLCWIVSKRFHCILINTDGRCYVTARAIVYYSVQFASKQHYATRCQIGEDASHKWVGSDSCEFEVQQHATFAGTRRGNLVRASVFTWHGQASTAGKVPRKAIAALNSMCLAPFLVHMGSSRRKTHDTIVVWQCTECW